MTTPKRKILFVCMPIIDFTEAPVQKYLFEARAIVNIPYGLLSICTYVQAKSHRDVELKIVNVNDQLVTEYRKNNIIGNIPQYFEDFVANEIEKFNPDVVGISLMFNVGFESLDPIVSRIKRVNRNIPVIVGGNLATVLYGEIALKEDVEAVCYGEGEIPFLQLAESDDVLTHIRGNSAFVTKESLKEGRIPVNEVVADLDAIPPIDFRFVNLSNFNLPKQKRGTVYKKDFSEQVVSRIIYTSRGCPYSCNFCAGFNVHGKKVRFLSIERVVDDVRNMIEKDGSTELYVCDDAFLIDKARAKTILREFVKMKISVNFPALLMRNIDDEVAELLAALGNTFQYTSMESGSDYVLRHIIQKPVTKKEASAAVHSLRKFGINVLTNIVVGSPGETDEHRKETLQTLEDIGFSWVFIMIALPLPGSSLYKQCEENGFLVSRYFSSPSLSKCNIRTPDYSPEHVEWQAYMMNLHINFVHNYNLRMGNYDECIVSFSNIIKTYPEHAFAHYFLAKAYDGKDEKGLAEEYRQNFKRLLSLQPFWRDWARHFGLFVSD